MAHEIRDVLKDLRPLLDIEAEIACRPFLQFRRIALFADSFRDRLCPFAPFTSG